MEARLAFALIIAAPLLPAWGNSESDTGKSSSSYEDVSVQLGAIKDGQDILSPPDHLVKRALHDPEEIMDTAEEVIFNPFYHQHVYQDQRREDVSRFPANQASVLQATSPQASTYQASLPQASTYQASVPQAPGPHPQASTLESSACHSSPHQVSAHQGPAPVATQNYVFRGTPFGAVFVKHQSEAHSHHK